MKYVLNEKVGSFLKQIWFLESFSTYLKFVWNSFRMMKYWRFNMNLLKFVFISFLRILPLDEFFNLAKSFQTYQYHIKCSNLLHGKSHPERIYYYIYYMVKEWYIIKGYWNAAGLCNYISYYTIIKFKYTMKHKTRTLIL